MRAAGAASVRDWLSQNYKGSRGSSQWVDLRNIATQADFELSGADMAETLRRLSTSDALEIGLRRLAA